MGTAGPWRFAWRRMRRDRWTVTALAALAVVLAFSVVGGPIVSRLVGHRGDVPFPYAVAGTGPTLHPVGPWTRVAATRQVQLDEYSQVLPAPKATPTTLLALGADGTLGRDELIRFFDGGRTSLEVGLGATLVAVLIALPIGAAAGYFGGFVDAVVARWTDTLMAFPLLLFLVFATIRLSPHLAGIAYGDVLPEGRLLRRAPDRRLQRRSTPAARAERAVRAPHRCCRPPGGRSTRTAAPTRRCG